MAFDPTLPTDMDRLRLAVGDISASPWLSDATYQALLTQGGSYAAALPLVFEAAISALGQLPTRMSADGTSVDYSNRLTALQAGLARAQAALVSTGAPPASTTGRVEIVF